MSENPNKTIFWDKFWYDNKFLNWKTLNYFNKIQIRISQLIAKFLLKQQSLNQIRHCLTGHNSNRQHYFNLKILKYSNDFQNQNLWVLWLKCNQTIKMKQNQTFFHGTYSNLTSYIFHQQILKYFNDFKNQNFSVLWLKWIQTMEMKQNQTFFHATYSNLTVFIGCKLLKYFNDFFNWHLPISLQKRVQA